MWYVDTVGLVKTPRGLTLNGVQHPRNIFTQWTKAELAAIGIKPASITAVDTRYKNTGELTWNTSGEEAVGTYATTDVDVATLKADMTSSVQSQAASILAQSDWYAIREAEGGTGKHIVRQFVQHLMQKKQRLLLLQMLMLSRHTKHIL